MNKYALLAWMIFFAITIGGLGFALWGAFGGIIGGVLGAVGSYPSEGST